VPPGRPHVLPDVDPVVGFAELINRSAPVHVALAHEVTVVVPTTGGSLLQGCLESIAAGTVWPARLVVVDQGRTGTAENSIAALRHCGMDVVHVPSHQIGISAATNRGLEQVHTSYAAVTHDDCRVRNDWLERLAARIAEVGDAILTGRVEPEGDGVVLTVKTDDDPATFVKPRMGGAVLFAPNMAFAVRLLDRIGWLDEHPSLATAGEDNEWAHRALRTGMRIVYDPTVVVSHLARHRPEDLPGLYRRYAKGQGAFYGTWLRRGDRFIARRAAVDLIRAPWLLMRGLVTRNTGLTSEGRGQLAGLLPGIVAGLRNPGVRAAKRR
jgi:GT2 family glycosyltransferase